MRESKRDYAVVAIVVLFILAAVGLAVLWLIPSNFSQIQPTQQESPGAKKQCHAFTPLACREKIAGISADMVQTPIIL
jgi:predicted PurR-regulated permease PerM